MIHAYLTIPASSSADDDEFSEGIDGSHGRHFQRCFHAVDSMTRELLGLAASDDSNQNTSRKPFDAKTSMTAPHHTSRLISKRKPQRRGSESELGDSEPERSDGGESFKHRRCGDGGGEPYLVYQTLAKTLPGLLVGVVKGYRAFRR